MMSFHTMQWMPQGTGLNSLAESGHVNWMGSPSDRRMMSVAWMLFWKQSSLGQRREQRWQSVELGAGPRKTMFYKTLKKPPSVFEPYSSFMQQESEFGLDNTHGPSWSNLNKPGVGQKHLGGQWVAKFLILKTHWGLGKQSPSVCCKRARLWFPFPPSPPLWSLPIYFS